MNLRLSAIAEHAAELRREFDHSFALPIQIDNTSNESLLAIRMRGQPYAIRLSEVSGLFADKKITPVPGGRAALCGIASFRGNIVPVYDLAVLLGMPRAQSPRWLTIIQGAPLALAFDAFVGHLRVATTAILAPAIGPEASDYTHGFVSTPEFSGPVVHLPSVASALNTLQFDATEQQEA